jgi:hypothetical protein
VIDLNRVNKNLDQSGVNTEVARFEGEFDAEYQARAILLTKEASPTRARAILEMLESGLIRTLGNHPEALVDVRLITQQDEDSVFVQFSDAGVQMAKDALGLGVLNKQSIEELLVRRASVEFEGLSLRSGAPEQTKRALAVDFVRPGDTNGASVKRSLAV